MGKKKASKSSKKKPKRPKSRDAGDESRKRPAKRRPREDDFQEPDDDAVFHEASCEVQDFSQFAVEEPKYDQPPAAALLINACVCGTSARGRQPGRWPITT